jgi:Mn-dependent DtxR family transcriptional regulator
MTSWVLYEDKIGVLKRADLGQIGKELWVSDLAEALGLSSSTVSNMVRRLAKRGFVNYQRYRGFTLTAEGAAVAAHIKDRHRTLTELLTLLGLGAETVEREVEDIEHHLTPQTLAALTALVAYWKNHPAELAAFRRFQARDSSAKNSETSSS